MKEREWYLNPRIERDEPRIDSKMKLLIKDRSGDNKRDANLENCVRIRINNKQSLRYGDIFGRHEHLNFMKAQIKIATYLNS